MTDKQIYAKLNPPLNTRDPLAMFSKFPFKEGHVNYHDLKQLKQLNACGCLERSCMEIRYTRTQKKEIFDVVKVINRTITIVPNDVVI